MYITLCDNLRINMETRGGKLKTKTSKQLKLDILEAVQALGGKNKLIELVKKDLSRGNTKSYWDLLNLASKFVPREIEGSIDHQHIINYISNVPRPREIKEELNVIGTTICSDEDEGVDDDNS